MHTVFFTLEKQQQFRLLGTYDAIINTEVTSDGIMVDILSSVGFCVELYIGDIKTTIESDLA